MGDPLPDPTTFRTDPCPEGWHYEWVPEAIFGWLAFRVVDDADARQCRMTNFGVRCTNQSVAKINRGRKNERWWHYCDEHLYGRRVSGRRVWVIHTVQTPEGGATTEGDTDG